MPTSDSSERSSAAPLDGRSDAGAAARAEVFAAAPPGDRGQPSAEQMSGGGQAGELGAGTDDERERFTGRDGQEVLEQDGPAWLASLILHMLVVIGLGIWFSAEEAEKGIQLNSLFAEEVGEQLEEESDTDSDPGDVSADLVSPTELIALDDPFQPEVVPDPLADFPTEIAESSADNPGIALSGRNDGMRDGLLRAYGGSQESEAAVLRGLKWLARQQREDGSWSLMGPYEHGAGRENDAAATSMALLAFLGAGHTHQRAGEFQETVRRGLEHLLSLQDADGNVFRTGRNNDWLYTQGQATIVLCEMYSLTRDPSLLEPATAAVRFCIEAQSPQGGWRYLPQTDSDTSVTGWVLMGLKSAEMAGIRVPSTVFESVHEFLDDVGREDDARYAYRQNMPATAPMTAEGLLCRQYLGWPRETVALERGVEYLLLDENMPSWDERNIYYWYYATQVMHHMEGGAWRRWNGVMRDLLVTNQVTLGPEAGSWHPLSPEPDRWGFHGGRLFVTCLSVCTLEVYYRHLPIYSAQSFAGQ